MSALTDRLRGMFDMGVKSEDAFNYLTPAGFRLLREASDEITRLRADVRSYETTFNMMHETAAEKDVVAERLRQKAVEGYDDAHDDVYQHGQLGTAAACYALTGAGTFPPISAMPTGFWPWDLKRWKPSAGRRDLVKAGALILAEIERLDRVASARDAA